MKRLAISFAAIAFASAAIAQTPAPDPGPNPTNSVRAELKSGAKVDVRQPDFIDDKLCGWVLPDGAPADAMPKSDCIPMSDIASMRPEGAKLVLGESVEGALCIVLMPLCLAKVAAAQDRIVEKAIEKAKTQ